MITPCVGERDGRKTSCPLALHGDAVPVVKVGKPGSRSFEAWNITSIRATGAVPSITQLLCGYYTDCVACPEQDSEDSLHEIWEKLVWSLHCA